MPQRIQKVLAEAGVDSRRAIEEMVVEGRVRVNGKTVAALPHFVEPGDRIEVDGRPVRWEKREEKFYFLLNKPKGVVCTQFDPQGRRRAVDLLGDVGSRVYCVGRLDIESTGLIILTNDGELTNQLTHPRYGVPKTYIVDVEGMVSGDKINRIKSGAMHIDGKRVGPSRVGVLARDHNTTLLQITLNESRNREIRRMLAMVGHEVKRLKRVAIGEITDKGVKIGNYRVLSPAEVQSLRKSAGPKPATAAKPRKSKPSGAKPSGGKPAGAKPRPDKTAAQPAHRRGGAASKPRPAQQEPRPAKRRIILPQ
ncbi:MAG: pseudouridine synthase [Planctomycetaceae bacterium]|nr:pseudouridine synthase [Planctomycetaceae bacterium]